MILVLAPVPVLVPGRMMEVIPQQTIFVFGRLGLHLSKDNGPAARGNSLITFISITEEGERSVGLRLMWVP